MKFPAQANVLRSLRNADGLTQVEVAAKLKGIEGPQFISNIERGICGIPPKYMKPLARLFKVSTSEFIEASIDDHRENLVRYVYKRK